MNLKSYYQNLPERSAPKSEFVRKLATMCGVGEPAVRLWIAGKSKPAKKEHYDVISKLTGIDKDKLFT